MEIVKEHAQPSNATAAPTTLDQAPQGSEIDETQHLCLSESPSQLTYMHHRREIKQRALGRGAWNSHEGCAVDGTKRSIAVSGYSLLATTTASRCSDVDRFAWIGSNTPQRCRRTMRKDSLRPTREGRRQHPGLDREGGVADCEDAVVNPVHAPGSDPGRDRALLDAKRPQLPQRHQPTLLQRYLSDFDIPPTPATGRNLQPTRRFRPVGGEVVGHGVSMAVIDAQGVRGVSRELAESGTK
jgi:hypothetical protein